ncbi:hypothetical protein Pla52o_16840 [Novipirellula galeiformis]|uniref:Uncharacterized protein n=1 Tax=Novipirellula galeiformis TaxID=2528004 RepID=A0A5C6CKI0_9BACT|nr:hypothetical protein Pla52o_16840 [Novipirellula galeiformis]
MRPPRGGFASWRAGCRTRASTRARLIAPARNDQRRQDVVAIFGTMPPALDRARLPNTCCSYLRPVRREGAWTGSQRKNFLAFVLAPTAAPSDRIEVVKTASTIRCPNLQNSTLARSSVERCGSCRIWCETTAKRSIEPVCTYDHYCDAFRVAKRWTAFLRTQLRMGSHVD